MSFQDDLQKAQQARWDAGAWERSGVSVSDPRQVTDPRIIAYVAEALPYLRFNVTSCVGTGPDGIQRVRCYPRGSRPGIEALLTTTSDREALRNENDHHDTVRVIHEALISPDLLREKIGVSQI